MRIFKKKYLCFFIFVLAACSPGKKNEPVIYTLRPQSTSESQQICKAKLNLKIMEPTISSGLESRRIAILQKDNRLDYYKGVRWAAPVPDILQTTLVDAFEKAPVFSSVSTDMDAVLPELILITDIRDFQVNEVKSPYAQIRFVSKLIRTKDHKIIATIPAENNIPPTAYKMDDLVAAFEQGITISVSEVVNKSVAVVCNK